MSRYSFRLLLIFILTVILAFSFSLRFWLIPSPLLNKSLPALHLSRLTSDDAFFEPQQLRGRVWQLNLWASWCSSCQKEHSLLLQLKQQADLDLVGLIYKDKAQNALDWLDHHGNPYSILVEDTQGSAFIALGVLGVPETYLIDKKGIVRYKHIGPIDDNDIQTTLLPLIKQLQTER